MKPRTGASKAKKLGKTEAAVLRTVEKTKADLASGRMAPEEVVWAKGHGASRPGEPKKANLHPDAIAMGLTMHGRAVVLAPVRAERLKGSELEIVAPSTDTASARAVLRSALSGIGVDPTGLRIRTPSVAPEMHLAIAMAALRAKGVVGDLDGWAFAGRMTITGAVDTIRYAASFADAPTLYPKKVRKVVLPVADIGRVGHPCVFALSLQDVVDAVRNAAPSVAPPPDPKPQHDHAYSANDLLLKPAVQAASLHPGTVILVLRAGLLELQAKRREPLNVFRAASFRPALSRAARDALRKAYDAKGESFFDAPPTRVVFPRGATPTSISGTEIPWVPGEAELAHHGVLVLAGIDRFPVDALKTALAHRNQSLIIAEMPRSAADTPDGLERIRMVQEGPYLPIVERTDQIEISNTIFRKRVDLRP